MTSSRQTTLIGVRRTAGLAVALAALPGTVVNAQTTFEWRPLLSVTEAHDSNLFSTPSDPQADAIFRLTPGVESQYRSMLMTVTGRYTVDVERFARHAELSTLTARQHGTIGWHYRPTPRLALIVGGELLRTRTPGELNVESGLTFARERAQRTMAQSSLTRQFTPRTSGTLEYSWTEDRLARGFEAQMHAAAASTVRRLSLRDSVNVRYGFRRFRFASDGTGRTPVTSHSISVGWTHAITRRIRLALGGGPRVTGDAFGPELAASMETTFKSVDLSVAYARTQTTVIGVEGAADIQNLTATAVWTPRRSLQVRMSPSLFRNLAAGRRADVYMMTIGVTRPISRHLAFDVSVDRSFQSGDFLAGPAGHRIIRQTVAIRLVALDANRPH